MSEFCSPDDLSKKRDFFTTSGMVINYFRIARRIVAFEAHNPNDSDASGEVCYLYELQVSKQFRCMGFGSLLFNEVERDAGKKPLVLQAHKVNEIACNFYLAKKCEMVKDFFTNGSTVTIFRKALTPKPTAKARRVGGGAPKLKPKKVDKTLLSTLTEPVRRRWHRTPRRTRCRTHALPHARAAARTR
jgi:hypothetical protein